MDSWFSIAERWDARGAHVHQKFTCGRCNERLTIIEPNIFYIEGSCSDCGFVTGVKLAGIDIEYSSDGTCRYGRPVLPLRVCRPKEQLR